MDATEGIRQREVPKETDSVENSSLQDEEEEKFALKREIGLWGGVSFFVGVMIGKWLRPYHVINSFIKEFIHKYS